MCTRLFQIEGSNQHPGFGRTIFLHQITPLIGDETVSVKGLPFFDADAVARHNRHAVAHRMTLHRAPPHPAGVEIGIIGFGSDGRGIE